MKTVLETLQDINLFSLLLGAIFLVGGVITKAFPPKKINLIYGYRTTRSMKNQENWDFAQQFAPREMLRGGWLLIIYSLSGMVFPSPIHVETIAGLILMTVIFVVMIRRTENALKRFEKSAPDN